MIAIERSSSPSILKEPEPDKDLYNRKEVVDALWAMQHAKCCYCESFIPAKGHLKAVADVLSLTGFSVREAVAGFWIPVLRRVFPFAGALRIVARATVGKGSR